MKTLPITKEQALSAMKNGEFEAGIAMSKPAVAVILTQDWCPQWSAVERYISALPENENLDVYVLVYSKVDYFEEFMEFKEVTWKNDQIPYIRYYKEGKLVKTTNYVSKEIFLNILGI